jgi:hypothetical protein
VKLYLHTDVFRDPNVADKAILRGFVTEDYKNRCVVCIYVFSGTSGYLWLRVRCYSHMHACKSERVSLTSSNASLTADPACRHYPSPHPFHPSLVPRAILYSASPLDREVFEDPLGIWRPRRMFGIRPQGMVD